MSDREKLWWDRVARGAALLGVLIGGLIFRIEAVAFYVALVGIWFGPDAYYQFGPGDKGRRGEG